jgi:hypothetical protein
MIGSISNREQILMSKFMEANIVRVSKEHIRRQIQAQSAIRKIVLQKGTSYLDEVERETVSAYRSRESRKHYKDMQKKSLDLQNSYLLYKKVMRVTHMQEKKIIRKVKPCRPKADPLPYLKHIKEKLEKSLNEDAESEIIVKKKVKGVKVGNEKTLIKNLSLHLKLKSNLKISSD